MEPGCVEEGLSKHNSGVAMSQGDAEPGDVSSRSKGSYSSQPALALRWSIVQWGRMKEKRTTERTKQGTIPEVPESKASKT